MTNSCGFTPSEAYFSKEVYSKELKTYKVVERNMIAFNPSRINVGSVALQDKADEVIVSPLYVVSPLTKGGFCRNTSYASLKASQD